MRTRTEAGDQIVVCDRKLTYYWSGQPDLQVGEGVLRPGNWVTDYKPFPMTVTAIGSDYTGALVGILGRFQGADR